MKSLTTEVEEVVVPSMQGSCSQEQLRNGMPGIVIKVTFGKMGTMPVPIKIHLSSPKI